MVQDREIVNNFLGTKWSAVQPDVTAYVQEQRTWAVQDPEDLGMWSTGVRKTCQLLLHIPPILTSQDDLEWEGLHGLGVCRSRELLSNARKTTLLTKLKLKELPLKFFFLVLLSPVWKECWIVKTQRSLLVNSLRLFIRVSRISQL